VLSNVLEHSPDPKQMLLDANRNLKAGGQVWISCPNSRSWLRGVFCARWINWHVPFHISHFSAKILGNLLQNAGFTPDGIQNISPSLWAAQSLIAKVFAKRGRPTHEIRNPILVMALLVSIRFLLFPALWIGNQWGRGDCLLVRASKV
jgi:hypothetical protein